MDLTIGYRQQTRQLARGPEDRFTVAVEADTLAIDLSDATLKQYMEIFCGSVAEAFVIAIDEISQDAAPTTIARRKRALESRKGKWYRQNYAGGRIGELLPKSGSTKLFQDSGRMKRFALNYRKTSRATHECTLNWPKNRFNPQITPRATQMLDRLQQVAPAFRGQFTGRGAAIVQQALDLQKSLVLAGKQEAYLLHLRKQAEIQGKAIAKLAAKHKTGGDA